MSTTHYLAVDLGAESGRVMLGTLAEGRLSLEEIHRFVTRSHMVKDRPYWILDQFEKEIFAGIEKAAQRGLPISGISTDSWGVDYILLDTKGNATTEPRCYRDSLFDESPPRIFQKLPFTAVYRETGIQLLGFNTLYQFESELHVGTGNLAQADHFLTIADYFNARFSGIEAIDQSIASTTQLYDPRAQNWSERLLAFLDLPKSFYPKIVPCGTALGPVIASLQRQSALAQAQVIATCSHDTGAAVAAVPAQTKGKWAYLSSGTWSLLGAELSEPVITDAAREAGFTNEVGLGGRIRFLKNIAGLWVLQECRRAWEAAGQSFTYEELTRQATENGPATAHLSLKDPRFVSPGDMPQKIAAFCRETHQPVPVTPGQYARTILESLARAYAETLRTLEGLVGHKMETLHIVGGGSRNDLLNQLTADATGIPVITGPAEATAIGNILIQALALKHIESFEHLRKIVAESFPLRTFAPAKL